MLDATPLLKLYARYRLAALRRSVPEAAQRHQLVKLLAAARDTDFGRIHDFAGIRSVADYQACMPLGGYEEFWRDWWQPTKDNYFGSLKHPQIVASLKEAGLTGAAGDAEKMKKGDAAAHAEHFMQHTRWVPAWLKGPESAGESGADDAASDTDSPDNDTTNTAHAA